MVVTCLHDYPELPGCICCSSPDCDLDPDADHPPCDHDRSQYDYDQDHLAGCKAIDCDDCEDIRAERSVE